MRHRDRHLLRYLLEDAASAEQAIGVTWTTPDGWERFGTGVPRALPGASSDATDAFIVLDTTSTASGEAIHLDAIVRVWVPEKPGETLWP